MALKAQITADMKAAMKAGDKDRLKVIRLILSAVKQIEVDKRIELGDADVLAVLNKMVKQRRDSVSQFLDGGRQDLADIETAEIAVIERYLPTPLSAEEVQSILAQAIADHNATGLRDMGKVMATVKEKTEGRADLGAISAMLKEKLGQ